MQTTFEFAYNEHPFVRYNRVWLYKNIGFGWPIEYLQGFPTYTESTKFGYESVEKILEKCAKNLSFFRSSSANNLISFNSFLQQKLISEERLRDDTFQFPSSFLTLNF